MSSWRGKVKIVDHPLAQEILTVVRSKDTGQIEFRKGLVRLGRLVGLDIISDMDHEKVSVETPLNVKAEGLRIVDLDHIVIINVLRAAIPFVEGLLKVLPKARQGIVSARRVEESMTSDYKFDIEVSYVKIPEITSRDTVIVADPMVATGSTMLRILEEVARRGKPKRLVIACVITTPLALDRILAAYPEVKVYAVAVDPELNERGFIVPGLGDAGDRAFGG